MTIAISNSLQSIKNNLHDGWSLSDLGDVVDILDGQRVPVNATEREKRKGDIPYYGATGQVGWIDDYLFDEELILLGEDGAPFFDPAKPKAYIIRGKSWVNNHAHVLRARNEIPNAYIKYYLDLFDYHGFVTGTTRLKLNQKSMRQIPIPIAPPNEQKLIVAEIEKQFSRLDEAVLNLKRVKANLKRYKAAVLKSAVEGNLTEEWRKANPDVEPARELLKHILSERKRKWEAEHPGKKYKKPAQPDTSNLPELPKGWVWVTVEQVCSKIVDCPHSTPKFKTTGNPCIDTTNIKPGQVIIDALRYVDNETFASRNRRLVPEKGDVVFAREGTVGTAVSLPESIKPCLGQRVMMMRPSTGLSSRYLQWVLNSEVIRQQYLHKILGTTAPHVNVGDVVQLVIPLPSIAEQETIVNEIDRCLSLTEEMEVAIETNIKRADRLRQSILKKAFRGILLRN